MSGGDPQDMVDGIPEHPEWHMQAACRQDGIDPEWFWAADNSRIPHSNYDRIARAKEVCARCPVQGLCLEAGVRNNEQFGIWGGTTPAERRAIKRRRRFRPDLSPTVPSH